MPKAVSEAKRFGLQILNYCDTQERCESESCRIIQDQIFSRSSYLKVSFKNTQLLRSYSFVLMSYGRLLSLWNGCLNDIGYGDNNEGMFIE